MSKRERIIALVSEISTLRARLKVLEDEFDGLVPPDDAAAVNATQRTTASNGLKPNSMANRIVHLLSDHPARQFDAAEIARELGIGNLNSLRGTLLRLAASKHIHKAGRGEFQARKELRTGS
jgi:hypothetical protein